MFRKYLYFLNLMINFECWWLVFYFNYIYIVYLSDYNNVFNLILWVFVVEDGKYLVIRVVIKI